MTMVVTHEVAAKMRSLFSSGMRMTEICSEVGCSAGQLAGLKFREKWTRTNGKDSHGRTRGRSYSFPPKPKPPPKVEPPPQVVREEVLDLKVPFSDVMGEMGPCKFTDGTGTLCCGRRALEIERKGRPVFTSFCPGHHRITHQ